MPWERHILWGKRNAAWSFRQTHLQVARAILLLYFLHCKHLPFQHIHFGQSDWQSLYVCIFVCKYRECTQHLFVQVIQEKGTKHHSYLNYSVCWFHLVAFFEAYTCAFKIRCQLPCHRVELWSALNAGFSYRAVEGHIFRIRRTSLVDMKHPHRLRWKGNCCKEELLLGGHNPGFFDQEKTQLLWLHRLHMQISVTLTLVRFDLLWQRKRFVYGSCHTPSSAPGLGALSPSLSLCSQYSTLSLG